MALKIDYVVRETTANLVRNISLSVASIVTVFVSLTLVGTSLLLRDAVGNATARWEGGIEFIVFFNPTATQDQIDAVKRDLDADPNVESSIFVDQAATFEEFKEMFSEQPAVVEAVTPEILPPSWRVVPVDKDAVIIEGLISAYETRPGVREVSAAFETIRTVQNFSGRISAAILLASLALLGASLLLIFNSIRMAMFTRRREIEVMKLVGASNWFIRIPFMLEGMVQTLVGSLMSLVVVAFIRDLFGKVADDPNAGLLGGFNVSGAELNNIFILLVSGGVLVGLLGSAVAVTRFLDV